MAGPDLPSRAASEDEITRGLLNAVLDNSEHTQRSLAQELGIALGLANGYIRRCVRKGWIKISEAPANRYAYYLTPSGFAEKSRLTAEFLAQSFNLFRQARKEYAEILTGCVRRGWLRIGFCGVGDLCELAALYAKDRQLHVVGIVDATAAGNIYAGLQVVASVEELGALDALVLTDVTAPQQTFDSIAVAFPRDRVIVPKLLGVTENASLVRG